MYSDSNNPVNFGGMKRSFWYGIGTLLLAGPAPVQAQSLTGVWQGVEAETSKPDAYWPTVLRLQKSKGSAVFGVLYEEVGSNPGITATFQMTGTRTATGLRLDHGMKLNETGRTPTSYWCDGSITFTYDAALEKLTGRAIYRPVGDCSMGTFTLYRIKLKSAETVPTGVESTIRVSGRNVLWFADAELKQPLTAGNTYRTKLTKTTTFYLRQGYYPTEQSPVVPITIKVTGAVAAKPAPIASAPDTVRPAPAVPPVPVVTATPAVLPTVLFKVGTPELLPEANTALDQLAAELKNRPTLRIRISGHTDRVGEPDKNQVLSEQRATAVKDYLVKAGIPDERISTIGYGDSRPRYPSPDARNRRVEVEEIK
jgi:OOP family OmpA-OmpF porin